MMDKICLKILAISIVLMMVVSCVAPCIAVVVVSSSSNTIYVADNYTKILGTVDNATAWDTVIAYNVNTPRITFDTGPGTSPSIFGTHKGTITPSQTITVSKLYTYPSPGTGGHTEYVKIWADALDVEATWTGYQGDWHNIIFNEPFTLEAGKTYNYTLRTGSYLQIIHPTMFHTIGEVITCTEFIDTNGEIDNDWISAIRLDGSAHGGSGGTDKDTIPPLVTSPSANPPAIPNDGTTTSFLSVNVTDDSAVDIVTIDLSPIGGHAKYVLTYYGAALFGCDISATCIPDTYNLTVNATDIYDNYNTSVNITIIVLPYLYGAPNITSWYPVETEIYDIEGATRTFNVTVNQTVNVSWLINGTEVFNETGVNESAYTNESAVTGYWNATAYVYNENGTDMQTWWWTVGIERPVIEFISPTPENGTEVTVNHVFINVTVASTRAIDTVLLNWNGVNETMYAGGESYFYSNKTNLPKGVYTYKVYANDIYDNWGVSETRVVKVNVTNPDLVVTDTWVCWPHNCTICYHVTNIGNGTAPAGHNTTLYVEGVGVAYDHVSVELAPGENYTGCFDDYIWTYTPPEDNITVCADNNNTVEESNETNNCLENIWMCGDVTGDDKVRTSDGRRIFHNLTYGVPIDNLWAADVTGDGRVRTSDGRRIFHNLTYGVPLNCTCCE